MKQIWIVFVVLLLVGCKSSDTKKETLSKDGTTESTSKVNGSLEQRLSEFMQVNDKMDLEKVLDYTYPKLFEIVPRPQLLEAMKQGFNNDEVKVELDSLQVDKIHPIFDEGKGSYAKVIYSMVMNMSLLKNNNDEETSKVILATLREKYGENNVTSNEAGVIRIRTTSPMVAVKDAYAKEWSFVNLKDDDPMIEKLFSKEVLDKLATYN